MIKIEKSKESYGSCNGCGHRGTPLWQLSLKKQSIDNATVTTVIYLCSKCLDELNGQLFNAFIERDKSGEIK